MLNFHKYIKSRISLKLLMIMAAWVFVFYALLTWNFVYRGNAIVRFMKTRESLMFSEDLAERLREAMLVKKTPSEIAQLIDYYTAKGHIKLSLFRGDGTLYYGSFKAKVPGDILSGEKDSASLEGKDFSYFEALVNERACYGCHNSKDRLRGVVGIMVPPEKSTMAVMGLVKRMALFNFLTAALSGLALMFIVNRMVVRPLKKITRGVEIIGEAGPDERIQFSGPDELGELARTLNRTAERLQDSVERANMEKLSAEMERKVSGEEFQGLFEAFAAEKEFADAIFQNTSSGMMVLDGGGQVLRINQAGLDILEAGYNDVIGKKISALAPSLDKMLSAAGAVQNELEFTTPAGKVKPIGYAGSPLVNYREGEAGIIILVFRDLTELKKLQADIRKKDHFEAMGKVISGVAHEIRNPLFAISSIGQLLQREISSAQHLALIEAMLKETGRMRNLVDELLLYSRSSKLNPVDIDPGWFFEEISNYLRIKGENVLISFSNPHGLKIKADRDKLKQVLLNLIHNAVGASATKIDAMTQRMDGLVEIRLSDNGQGINDKHLEKIFDPFFTTKKEGTGLGLPICRKIIEEHGGTIEIESAEGRGTTVIIRLRA